MSATNNSSTGDPAAGAPRQHAEDDRVAEIRHDCHRLLIIVKPRGIQLKCDKCNREVLYTWRQVLTMMLSAEMGAG